MEAAGGRWRLLRKRATRHRHPGRGSRPLRIPPGRAGRTVPPATPGREAPLRGRRDDQNARRLHTGWRRRPRPNEDQRGRLGRRRCARPASGPSVRNMAAPIAEATSCSPKTSALTKTRSSEGPKSSCGKEDGKPLEFWRHGVHPGAGRLGTATASSSWWREQTRGESGTGKRSTSAQARPAIPRRLVDRRASRASDGEVEAAHPPRLTNLRSYEPVSVWSVGQFLRMVLHPTRHSRETGSP